MAIESTAVRSSPASLERRASLVQPPYVINRANDSRSVLTRAVNRRADGAIAYFRGRKTCMSELDALRTATIHAADLLDVDDRGRVQAGLLADFIAVPGNPLDDITVTKDVRFVMLGGRVIKHVMDGRDMHSTSN